jgi:apolipoprotein N-acyltransferase
MRFSLSLFLAFIAGGLYALTYPATWMPGWLPLLFIAVPLFLWLLERTKNLKQSLTVILFYNIGLNVVGFYWVPHTLREFGQLPWIVSVILGLLFSFILQPHWWLYALWKKFRPDFNWRTEKGVLITALLMTLMERYFPQQFPTFVGSPWLHLAPYLGTVPYVGVVTMSFMTFWLSQEVVTQIEMRKMRPQVFIVFVLFVAVNALMPLKIEDHGNRLNVRIVQANVGNFLKVASESGDQNSFSSINKDYFDLSVKENGFTPDLIVWPETAYSSSFYSYSSQIPEIFINIMNKTGAEMLIGGYVQDASKDMFDIIESVFNASVLMSGTKIKTSYHKNILIPFGETLPFGPFNRQVVSIVPAVSLFARGNGTPLMETKSGQRFVTPICYEILESNYMRALLNQYGNNRFIVNHTNDSWYGDTAEPHQHLFLSKWRALEFQLPIIRSTNTGISSVIYPDGSESKRLNVGEKDVLDVSVPMGSGEATFYQTWGVWPLILIFGMLLIIIVFREKRPK